MSSEWANVGQAVRDRRHERDLTQKEAAIAAGVSDTTWLALESGRPVSHRTARNACKALQWTPDSIERILQGNPPVVALAEPADDDKLAALRAEVEELRRIVERLDSPRGGPR